MTLRTMTGIALLLPALLLVGCGDDDASSAPKFTAALGTMSQADATTYKAQLASGVKPTLTGGAPTGAPSARDEAFSSCTTKSPETTTDADADYIATQTRTYACTNVAGETRTTYTQNGTATVTDKDDNDAKSGWKFTYDITGGHSGGDVWAWKGFWELTVGPTITYESDYKGTFGDTTNGEIGVAGGTYKHTITPTDAALPYTMGGTMTMDGYFAYNFGSSNYVFKVASTGLTYGATPCSNFFNGGKFSYTDASSNVIEITFTDCNTYTTTHNGNAI